MYCPRCATHNNDDTKYCRSCGANLSLVPQALSGRLPEPSRSRRHRRHEHDGPATLEGGITKLFMGIGFILVAAGAFFFAPAGHIWWFWMLVPAFALLGRGIAEIVSLKFGAGLTQPSSQTSLPTESHVGQLPPRGDAAHQQPSVTEQTTRQLDRTTDPYRYRDRDAH